LATGDGLNMQTYTTYADILRPCEKTSAALYDAALILGGSLFVGLSAQMAILLPFSPVPITGQTFAVLLLGAMLGARRGCLCMLAYIAEGAAGLPVFSLGQAGPAVLLGPRGGYIAGFVAAACVTGFLAEKGWDRRIISTILAMICGNIAIYAFGLLWLSFLMGFNPSTLAVGLYPFLLGDSLKILLAAVLLPAGWRLLPCIRRRAGDG
jgi:biotin transport system substrate-specific component